MRYGCTPRVHDYEQLTVISQVLRPDGQPTSRARSEILQGHLSRPEWCVVMKVHDYHLTQHHCAVPVIVVFTKYDEFLLNVGMDIMDYPIKHPDSNVSEVAEKRFQEHYCIRLVMTLNMSD